MTAPRSVIFNKDIILVVEDEVVKLFSNNNLDWLRVVLGNISRLETSFNLASFELINEVFDGFNTQIFD